MPEFPDNSKTFLAFAGSYSIYQSSSGSSLSGRLGLRNSPSVVFRSSDGKNPDPDENVEIWRANQDGTYTFLRSATYVGWAFVSTSFFEFSNPIFKEADGTFSVYGPSGGGVDPLAYSASVFCFLAGTLIATPQGEVEVESLQIGDLVSTTDGGVRKVLWIGKQTVSTVFAPASSLPVEISIGAFGETFPKRPLRVSPGHSLLVEGAFPIASALVNGTTVRQLIKDELPETFTYYHVEVEDHALIIAEGVPAETFLDAWSRRTFDNWSEYVALYGEEERAVQPSELHFKRILDFDGLPTALKERLGTPLPKHGRCAA